VLNISQERQRKHRMIVNECNSYLIILITESVQQQIGIPAATRGTCRYLRKWKA